jgi:hypothetical protein
VASRGRPSAPLPLLAPLSSSKPRLPLVPAAAAGGGGGGGRGGGFGAGPSSSSSAPPKKKKSNNNKKRKPSGGGGGGQKSRSPSPLDYDDNEDDEDLEALAAEAEEAAAAAAARGGNADGTDDGTAANDNFNPPPSPEVLYAALQPVPPPEPYVGPVRAARVEGGKAGMGVVATRTLAAGELALVCLPLAAARRLPAEREGEEGEDEEDNNSGSDDDQQSAPNSNNNDDGAAAYEPDDDDLDALAGQLLAAATAGGDADRQRRRALAWLSYIESDDGSGAAAEPSLRDLAGAFIDDDDDEEGDEEKQPQQQPLPPPPSQGTDAYASLEHACADATDLAFRVELEDAAASTLRRAIDEAAGAPVGPDELRRAAAGAAMDADAAAAAAEAQGTPAKIAAPPGVPAAVVGLWPAFSLFNHSCAPTASVVAVDDPSGGAGSSGGDNSTTPLVALHVRAARPVAKGAELTASHLPPSLLLSPLSARRAALEREHGLASCSCPRCRDEARQDPKLRDLIEDLHAAATSAVAPALADALARGDGQAVRRCRDQCAAYAEVADAAFARLALRPRSQLWAQASLFRLYEALALAVAASGEGRDPRLLELLAALAGLAAPGSPEHVFWARQFLADEEGSSAGGEEEEDDGARRHADGGCYRAHEARYGKGMGRALYGALALAAGAAEEMAGGAGGDGDEDDEDDGEEDD